MADVRPLILIPSYNTGPILRRTIDAALAHPVPVWIVIDGSTDGSPELLADLESGGGPPPCRIIHLPRNSGKGSAILEGIRRAKPEGFTHVLTMDADGQHPADFIPRFLRLSASHPEALILGRPIFDTCAPPLRVGGRKISNFWTNLETLGWGIDDSLFGMRLYPMDVLLSVFESTRFARRFDFDPEVAVRLAWRGVPIINLPTPVKYPTEEEGGISQFRYLRDNVLLTWMHLRLMGGFLLRAPILLARGRNPLEPFNPPSA